MEKKIYLDLMERAVSAYTDERTQAYIADVRDNLISEHGFCRLTANTGFLIAHGRMTDKKDEFREMMDLCCTQIPVARARHGHRTGNDFSVKEIVICLLELEKYAVFPKEITDSWRIMLGRINPYETYSCIASVPPERISNWAAFAAVSEQLLIYAGIGGDRAFIDNQIASQLLSFDEKGMFRDPHEPIVYDMVTRLQLAAALYFGYDGAHRKALEEQLLKSADATLFMQSVTGEIPFGGRSNQFLHNDSFYAALCEYYASLFSAAGDRKKAAEFRGAAELAVADLTKWLSRPDISHIKNGYDPDVGFGCEGYGYFNKYMVTMGSWCMLAYAMADAAVNASPCPARGSSFAFETSEHFHKLILTSGGYTAEIELCPDMNYDCAGIGRVQRTGASPVICLSVPCPTAPKYKLPEPNEYPLSLAPGIRTPEGMKFALTAETPYTVLSSGSDGKHSYAKLKTEITDANGTAREVYLSIQAGPDGVEITAESDTDTFLLLPAFETDGKKASVISSGPANTLMSAYDGSSCVYRSASAVTDMGYSSFNRNGKYRAYCTGGGKLAALHIDIN